MSQSLLTKHPSIVLKETATLRDAMEAITKTQVGIALVVGKDRRLRGILVDIDIRRALLRGEEMSAKVAQAMNKTPFTLPDTASRERVAATFAEQRKAYIPLVDARGRLSGLAAMVDYMALPKPAPNWVVIMAGGQGRRLRPLTDNLPKPMMRVGDKPLLEHVVQRLVGAGLNRFIFTVNYLADHIESHFGDGSRWGAQIEYVREKKEMGTAGALGLIKRDLERPFIVMNGDLLTKIDFRALLEFHEQEGNAATMCVREYDFQVPYGVVQIKDNKLAALVEKPVHKFFVNAGIYVLGPAALKSLKKAGKRDMTELMETLRGDDARGVGCFPVQEYWLDIGKPEDYQKAVQEYGQHFIS